MIPIRRKKLFLNTTTAMLNQVVTLICGFILPRLIIAHYGSATNGLISSITQFLAFFSMMDMGVGAVVRSSLYKPLADGDNDGISRVLIASRRFFNKIGLLLCLYAAALMILFPICVDHSIGYIATAVLVFSIAFSSIANYFLGIVYAQLLNADQRSYVRMLILILVTVLNTLFGVILIHMNAPIHIVKLLAAVVILLRPMLLKLYVDKHYDLNFKLELTGEPLKQKWNGLAQHLAQYVLKHADTVILTLMSTLENVSIYYVYHLVTNGLQQMIEILTTGIQALFGNIYAKKETEKLNTMFSAFELIIHTFVTLIYTAAGVLILPFVQVYTNNISDINYLIPAFAVLIVAANGAYCLRLPYNIMVLAAGHFKQTQASALIEAGLNVIISVLLVHKLGLIGVAIGTLAAMLYRTVYLSWYLRSNIMNRAFIHFVKHIIIDGLTIFAIVAATSWIHMSTVSWWAWVITAVEVMVIACVIVVIINSIFYRSILKDSIELLFRKRKKKS